MVFHILAVLLPKNVFCDILHVLQNLYIMFICAYFFRLAPFEIVLHILPDFCSELLLDHIQDIKNAVGRDQVAVQQFKYQIIHLAYAVNPLPKEWAL